MQGIIKAGTFVGRALRSLWSRLRTQGLRSTLVVLYGRGIPLLTGVPTLSRYSQIAPSLFIGAQHRRAGKVKLTRLGIRCTVSLRAEFDDAAHGLVLERYCYLPTIDNTAPTIQQLREGVGFIREALGAGEKVYVHCQAGVGRAPTLAAAYLIAEGWSWKEAVEHIALVRPFVQITPSQRERLELFELLERSGKEDSVS